MRRAYIGWGLGIVGFLLSIYVAYLSLFPIAIYLSPQPGIARLERVLAEDWVEYSDENLGLSVMYPSSWKASNGSIGDLINVVSFHKNPRGSEIERLLNDERFVQWKSTVNGTTSTVLAYPDDVKYDLLAGQHRISEDHSLEISLIRGVDENDRLIDKIFLRILESIRPL